MKEFVLAMLLQFGIGEDIGVKIGLADLPDGVYGETNCQTRTYPDGSIQAQCTLLVDRDRWTDTSHTRWGAKRAKYSNAENTLVHELCHIEVFEHYLRKYEKDLDNKVLAGYHAHGREWRRCAKKRGAWISPHQKLN